MRYPALTRKQTIRTAVLFILFFTTLFMAQLIANNGTVQYYTAEFGYAGIFVIAIISGFNIIVPIHAATFTPIFLAAGYPLIGITIALTLGITIADLVSFWVGVMGKHFARDKYHKQLERMEHMIERKWWLPLAFLFFYAIFAPVPNELVLMPLAILGVPFHRVLLPLLAGNAIHMTLINYGISFFVAGQFTP